MPSPNSNRPAWRFATWRHFRNATMITAIMAVAIAGFHHANGQRPEPTMASHLNVPMPTLGGSQLWTDQRHRNGVRIQQHALTGHYRMLDAKNIRRAWGSLDDVQIAFNQACPEPLKPSQKPIVVLIHGLIRTDACMKPLEKQFNEAGYDQVIRFGYASSRSSLAESAVALRQVLEDQHPDAEFCFVGHSMGNIITRHLVHDLQSGDDAFGILPRCRSMVMLGPPNQGAMIAKRLGMTGVFGWVAGPGAMELGPNWVDVESQLAVPTFPFAVVAGNVKPIVPNPLTDGAGDFVVSLDEAQLKGSEIVHEVPVLHSFLMNDPEVQKFTIGFINKH